MTRRRRLTLVLALAIGPATFAACDLLITEPAPASSEVGIAFQLEGTPLGGSATAFSRVRRIGLRFIRPDSTVRDTVVAVVPVDGVIRTGIVVPATERVAALGVQARLGYDTIALFQGSAIVQIVAGSPTTAEVSLSPVPDRVVADPAQISLAGPGATNVVSARVLFASGDTIDGLSGIWSSADPGIAVVGPNGTVVAQSPGLTDLEVRFGTLADTVAVEVLPAPPPPPPPPPTGGPNRWIEALGGLWSDPAHWSLGRIPIVGDTVVIDLDGVYSVDVDLDLPVLSAIRVGASVGSQTVTVSGRVVATAGDVTVAGTGSLILDGTTLTSAGLAVEAGASLTLRSGAVVNAPLTNGGDVVADNAGAFLNGAVTVAAGASLRVGGGTFVASLTIATGFSNEGLIELSGGTRLTVGSGTLINAPGGVIAGVSGPIAGTAFLTAELDNQGTFSIETALELDAVGVAHVNVGTLISTAGASVRITGADAFANAGVLDLGTGSGDVTLSGSGAGFTTSGSIVVGGGQLSIFNGPYAHTAGAISGAGTLSLYGLTATASVPIALGTNVPTFFQMYGSTLTAQRVTTASGTGFLLDASTLNGALTNQGSVAAIGAGVSTVGGAAGSASGATIMVESGVGGDTELVFAGGLTNAGFLVLTNSTGATGALLTVSGGVLVNTPTGTVNAATGGLGARVITAEIDNQGFISSNLDLTIDATGTTLTNSGTLTTNTADAIAVVGADAFLNSGTVNAAPGSISIGLSGAGPGLTNSATLIVGAGATLSVDNGVFASPTGGVGGAGLLELVGVTATLGSPIPWTLGTTGPASVGLEGSTLTAVGVVVDTTTTLTLEGSTLDAAIETRGVLQVIDGVSDITGAMTTGPTGVIRVTGGATVGATLDVRNGFTNNGVIELTSAGTGDATLAIGSGSLANGGSGVITSTTSAGNGGVRTIAADVSQIGAISLQAPLTIAGQLVDPAGVPSTYAGNGNGLTVSGLNVSGAVFDDMAVTSIGGSLTLFTGSTFQNMDPTATQLTIEHPGTLAGLLSFSSLTFATPPTPGVGYYVRVTDTDPLTLPLVVEVLLSSPLTGLLLSLVGGGATLLW